MNTRPTAMAEIGIVGASPSNASKARDYGRATSNHPGPSSRRITSAFPALPPLMLPQDPELPSFEKRVMRTPSPSPVTDESGSSHLPLSFSFVTSLPEYRSRTSADVVKLWKQTRDVAWLETGRQWENKYGAPFPLSKDENFRNLIQGHRSSENEMEREWQHMWLLQRREWSITKFTAHLRKEGAQQRIQSWVETGVYHRDSMEFWERMSAPEMFRDPIGAKITLSALKAPRRLSEPPIPINEPALPPTQELYGLWERNGRWGDASGHSSKSSASSVASIKDALQVDWKEEELMRSLRKVPMTRSTYPSGSSAAQWPTNPQISRSNRTTESRNTPFKARSTVPTPGHFSRDSSLSIRTDDPRTDVQPHVLNRSSNSESTRKSAGVNPSNAFAALTAFLERHLTINNLQIEADETTHEPHHPTRSESCNPLTRTGTNPEDIEISNLILSDSRPYASNIRNQGRAACLESMDNNPNADYSSVLNPAHGKGSVKRTKSTDQEERQTTKQTLAVEEQEHQGRGDEPEKDIPIIGKQTSLDDIIRHLTESGCQDLTRSLNLATFPEYPVCHGGFSDVYRGCLEIGTQVAVKALRISEESIQNPKHLKRAARELHTWSSCQHRNVLQLLGLTIFRGRIGMVSPWLDCGDLPRYLKGTANVDRCNLCTQICDGLAYLHSIGIVHGDLKGANVLVLHDGTPVLGDFGNSILLGRKLQFTETTQQPSWSIRWAAPEFLHESDKQSEAADVYALGMTILEVMTGEYPYDGKSDFMVVALVSQRKPPERPQEHIPTESSDGNKLWELLQRCWEYDPNKRPSAAEVTAVMGSITSQGLKAKNAL